LRPYLLAIGSHLSYTETVYHCAVCNVCGDFDARRDIRRRTSIGRIKRRSEGGTKATHAFGRLSIVLSLIDVTRLQRLSKTRDWKTQEWT